MKRTYFTRQNQYLLILFSLLFSQFSFAQQGYTSQSEDGNCNPNDFIVVCRPGAMDVLTNPSDGDCLEIDSLQDQLHIEVRLANLHTNQLQCDLIVEANLSTEYGEVTIYSEPLQFECKPTNMCGCGTIPFCTAVAEFNITDPTTFDPLCPGLPSVGLLVEARAVYDCEDEGIVSPNFSNGDCDDLIPPCLNLPENEYAYGFGCLSCAIPNPKPVTSTIHNALMSSDNETVTTRENRTLSNEPMVYPNPAQDILYIKHTETITSVLDRTGKPVNVIIEKQRNGQVKVDISQLDSGLYFIQFENELQRFIKL